MKNVLFTLCMLASMSIAASTSPVIITTGTDIAEQIESFAPGSKVLGKYETTAIIETRENALAEIAKRAHEKGKCGGFFIHDTIADARNSISNSTKETKSRNYVVRDLGIVKDAIAKVSPKNIESFIRRLSTFHNRFYTSESGVKAAHMIRDEWNKYAPTVLYPHKSWKQPSVIATITGSKYPDEVIVLGGHIDSINGWWGQAGKRAPGADDNASGTSTVTETLRVLTESGYKPPRTIKFMGYAAEEVGLRGSAEIAADFKSKGVNVIGAMQLDMTNYKGSDKTIYLVQDYTNKTQTQFLTQLIKTYVKVPYGMTKCGYACSDHASWHKNGYPAVFPFEAGKNGMNKKIHTAGDTIEVSGGHALHAASFAKLALSYLIEVDSQGI